MKVRIVRRLRTAHLASCLLLLGAFASSSSSAQPESAGAWMGYYGPALGLSSEGLPGELEWVDEITATVDSPRHLLAFGVEGVTHHEKLILTNHENGYWTIHLSSTDRQFTIPLAYLVRFGVVPDRDLSAEPVPSRISGRVVVREILAKYEFKTAATSERFELKFEDGAWWLTLEPGGERRSVPF